MQRLRATTRRSVVPVFLEELDRPVAAVYEAGPTGSTLARGESRKSAAWNRAGTRIDPEVAG